MSGIETSPVKCAVKSCKANVLNRKVDSGLSEMCSKSLKIMAGIETSPLNVAFRDVQ